MSGTNQSTAESTFVEVVEKLTFMFGEQVDVADVVTDAEPWVEARMGFSGDLEGTLAVVVPVSLQTEIASNIMGLDADASYTQDVLDDALRELINVVCGHVIMVLAGDDANFDLHPPQTDVLDGAALDALCADAGTTGYLLDDEPVLLHLHLIQE